MLVVLRNRIGIVATIALGALAVVATAFAGGYPAAAPLAVPDSPGAGSVGSSTPSQVSVSGEPSVSKLTVRVFGLTHNQPDDIDLLLVGPQGQSVILMSDAGGDPGQLRPADGPTPNSPVANVDLSFDDLGAPLPDESTIASGTYRPTNHGPSAALGCSGEPSTDVFPLAPAGPYGSALSVFDGTDPNGTWTLYAVDDCNGYPGSFGGGWSLGVNILTAVGVHSFNARGIPGRVALSWRTSSETDVLGFNVYRASGKVHAAKLNTRLIPAHSLANGGHGSTYRLSDSHVRAGSSYTYRLQVVRLNGARAWAGASALQVH